MPRQRAGSVLVGTRTIPSTFEAQETRQESANVYETKVKINTAYCIAKLEMPFTRMIETSHLAPEKEWP